ncbi:hypothetical protein [Planctellipticum variicoloris]|nr:hypothetical protein [Planctomycetaceae bacterium]
MQDLVRLEMTAEVPREILTPASGSAMAVNDFGILLVQRCFSRE